MKVVLVRNIETKGLLGVFWTPSLKILWDVVDETSDPEEYEYTLIGELGGIVFIEDQPIVKQWKDVDEDFDEGEELSWSEATTSEMLDRYIYEQDKHSWHPVLEP